MKDTMFFDRTNIFLFFLLLLMSIIVFFTGYFCGKRSVYKEILENSRADFLNDKISAAFYSLYDYNSNNDDQSDQEEDSVENEISNDVNEKRLYQAELINCHTIEEATKKTDFLKKKGIQTYTCKRSSKNSAGLSSVWYQILTNPMEYDLLQSTIEKIKSADGFSKISFIEYNQDEQRTA